MKKILKYKFIILQWIFIVAIVFAFHIISKSIQSEKEKDNCKTGTEILRPFDMINLKFSCFMNQ